MGDPSSRFIAAQSKKSSLPSHESTQHAAKDQGLRTSNPSKWYFATGYLLIAVFCYWGMWIKPAQYGLFKHLDTVLTTGEFPYDSAGGVPLKRNYIGVKAVDDIFVFLSAVYTSALVKDWEPSLRFMLLYFLGILIQPFAVWMVEGFRRSNRRTLLSFVTVWFGALQFIGTGIIIPLYYVAYCFVSDRKNYWVPLHREVPVKYSDTLIWAVTVGYTVPTMVLFMDHPDPFTLQNIESFWQISPCLVPPLCSLLASFHGFIKPTTAEDSKQEQKQKSPKPSQNMNSLKHLYLVTGVMGVLFHWYCITKVVFDPELTLSSVFWPDFTTQDKTLGEGVKFMLLIDVWTFEVATYIWSCQAVWELKRIGHTDADATRAAALIALATVVVGPGATLCAVWSWREEKLATTKSAAAHREL
ncbi:uncharacterized protein AB675_3255 [Cyphellophora attinorum]|uniref:Uncharacterized protein n=1 Tax=Cyphellophora attinorum TaxID=1664694 RepID=A0A0N0NM65_9EURO|nr:uncharacterized protein AB675_3255 [Phialophora attinorum]KPI39849.1 hypothetical protein AB675_3255 [Phialophora attinorum]